MKLKYFLSLITLASVLPVMAQYQWIDANGRKVFSDQPPPANISGKSILQEPRKLKVDDVKANTGKSSVDGIGGGTTNESTKPATNKPEALQKIVGKDKDLEAKKKQADDAEAAKKKAEDDKLAKAKADNCERAKRAKASLDSGVRIATTNSKGEREFMDEAARMVETKRIQGIMQADCK